MDEKDCGVRPADGQADYLAHIAEDGSTQTVAEHLEGTARLAARFAAAFGAQEQGRMLGLAHDIGKYTREFQRRLAGGARVDHATAGAFECARRRAQWGAFCVAGHHGGLPDGGNPSQARADGSALLDRIKRAAEGKLPDYSAWPGELPAAADPAGYGRDLLLDALYIRMLYSCLVDADFLDTEAFMRREAPPRGGHDSPQTLLDKLEGHIAEKGWLTGAGDLNAQRSAILRACLEGGTAGERGLYTLTVPTGGGKTVASLAFALRHAVAHGLDRVIYVIPYTSIIDQTVETFQGFLGEENVVAHHSAAGYDLEENPTPRQRRQAQATENWDAPIIVTTAVQFFESLYASRSSQCRKLHNIANSVVIFDEAQTIPIDHLRPCVAAIAQLVEHFRVTAVLCTATQPALEGVIHEFAPDLPITELAPAGVVTRPEFRRVTFRRRDAMSRGELAQALSDQKQALCVVNTRKGAQELYRLLPTEGSFHLSTLMCPAHRRAVLEEIRRRLQPDVNEPCRVVSTSLIEAGVDVDFPALWREEAGLDAMLQAAGRCNREGKRAAGESIVTIFQGEDAPPLLFRKNIAATREGLCGRADLQDPAAIHAYFLALRDLTRGELDKTGQIKGFRVGISGTALPFRTLAERFHLINNATKTIYIPWAGGKELIDRLRTGDFSRTLFRKLGPYTVNVYEEHYKNLLTAGVLQPMDVESAILTDISLYSETTGLSLKADTGKGWFE